MFGFGPATRVSLAVGATDMRKGFEGLYGLVRDRLGCEPLSDHVFLFCNGRRDPCCPLQTLLALVPESKPEVADVSSKSQDWIHIGSAQAGGKVAARKLPADEAIVEKRRTTESSFMMHASEASKMQRFSRIVKSEATGAKKRDNDEPRRQTPASGIFYNYQYLTSPGLLTHY